MRRFSSSSSFGPTLESRSHPIVGAGRVDHRLRARFWRAYSLGVTLVVFLVFLWGLRR
ncbi:MAG: hypothetical protein KGJ57_18310 [Sphingomonadales bacterium]|nr:hypothetical protein [Sphingomonadales bacterium]MDE2171353.1 hypothetical protein [Sphingomonadales bacterium]